MPPPQGTAPALDPALVLGLLTLCWIGAWILGKKLKAAAEREASDPRTILKNCRACLNTVRRELEKIPATREAHDLYAQIESTQLTIDETEAALAKSGR